MTTDTGSADAGNPDGGNAGTGNDTGNNAGTGAPAHWSAGIEDTELKGWVESKGYHKLAEKDAILAVGSSYRNLEKLMGADKAGRTVEIPTNLDDKAASDAFYSKLGRPDTKDKYELTVPEGVDPGFADWAKGTFHDLGLTARQAKALGEKWNEYVGGVTKDKTDAYHAQIANDEAALKKEWGAAFDNNIKIAKNAAREFITNAGMGADVIDKLEEVMGFGGLMKFFSSIGAKIGEDNFVGGDSSADFGPLTPAAAQSKLSDLMADKEFSARYLSGEKEAVRRVTDLNKMIVAGKAA